MHLLLVYWFVYLHCVSQLHPLNMALMFSRVSMLVSPFWLRCVTFGIQFFGQIWSSYIPYKNIAVSTHKKQEVEKEHMVSSRYQNSKHICTSIMSLDQKQWEQKNKRCNLGQKIYLSKVQIIYYKLISQNSLCCLPLLL
jgi:hypothetical protein